MAYKYTYDVHPLANLFAELTGTDYKKLRDDIQRHGQQVPITLSTDGTTLLDGRNRLRACKELGIEPRVDRLEAKHSESDFIWSINVLRRHLTDDQRAAIAVKWSDTEKQAAKLRQKAGVKLPLGENAQRSRDALAKKAEVSTHKIRQAETLAKENPAAVDDVASGKVSLKKAMPKRKPKPKRKRESVEDYLRKKYPDVGSAWREKQNTQNVAVQVEPRETRPEINVAVTVEPATPPTPKALVEETVRRCFAFTLECAKHLTLQERSDTYERLAEQLKDEAEQAYDEWLDAEADARVHRKTANSTEKQT